MEGTELQSGTTQLERSYPKPEDKHTKPVRNRRTESSRQGFKGDGEWERDSHRVTQHQVGAGRGFGECAERTTARQNRDWSLAVEKLTGGIHTRFSSGYKVWATEVGSIKWGGISIVWREKGG